MTTPNRRKIKAILEAKELLRIESTLRKVKSYFILILIALVSIGYIFIIRVPQDEEMLFIWIATISIIYALILAVIYRSSKGGGNPLIFTERGIVIDPLLAETWEDIASYSWEKFQGYSRTSFTHRGVRICLKIINKSLVQRNIETWTGHTMMAQYGIYFQPEQITRAENIFEKYGIKKNND